MFDLGAAERLLQLRRIVRRETIRLVVLTAIAAAAFLMTRIIAQRTEELAVRDAAAWFDRGQQHLRRSEPEQAAVAFRRATSKDPGEKRYVLALAEALARSGNREPAARALLQLREFSPEDAGVNLALARLARAQGETAEALRYYHHAIYAPASTPDRAREVRVELVRMLLESNEAARAVPELMAATIDLPEAPAVRLELAALFERAGDLARAEAQYRRVLAGEPAEVAAMEGAVRTAFALGDYPGVLAYELPEAASSESRRLVGIASEVIARDPLARRLSATERRRRLLHNITYLEQRWTECGLLPAPPSPDYPQSLHDLRASARPPAIGRDLEALEAAVATIDRVRLQLEPRCAEATPIDRALEIIARLHGVGPP